jgi:hypothetical protein
MLTRSFIMLLNGCLRGGESPLSWQLSMDRPQFTQEANADVVILPDHLRSKTLDDIAEQLLLPAAWKMAEDLREHRAGVIFEAEMAPPGVECVRHRYDNISVRGMVMRGVEIDGLIVDAFRFTVFYREAQLQ